MQEIRRRKVAGLGLRIAAPKLGRALALLLLVCAVAAVAISYWRLKDRTAFRLRPGVARLSTEVVGVITNLEHTEMKGDRLWVMLKADRDVQYSDGHHQLENVHLEVYPEQGDVPDKISARQTLTNEDNTQFLFTGNVVIETRDKLTARPSRSSTMPRPRRGTSPRPSSSSARTFRGAPTLPTSTRRPRSST
jgi:LPS export ABC transporter protein LptC